MQSTLPCHVLHLPEQVFFGRAQLVHLWSAAVETYGLGFMVYGLGFEDLSLQQLDLCGALRAELNQTLVVPQLTPERRKLDWGLDSMGGHGGAWHDTCQMSHFKRHLRVL